MMINVKKRPSLLAGLFLMGSVLFVCWLINRIYLEEKHSKKHISLNEITETDNNVEGLEAEYDYSELAWWADSYQDGFPDKYADRFSWGDKCFTKGNIQFGLPPCSASKADNVIVALIDSGFCTELISSSVFWVNKKEIPNDGIDNDNNGFTDDIIGASMRPGLELCSTSEADNSHGTYLLNLLCGETTEYRGLLCGTRVQIMLVRVLDNKGYCSIDSIINAIEYADSMGQISVA